MYEDIYNVYNSSESKFYLAKISGSEQEQDLTLPPNQNGFGRIRHFRRFQFTDWIQDPLPIDPAIKYLNLTYTNTLSTQCFQIASCNLDCWYCFVPASLKKGRKTCGEWFSAEQIVNGVLEQENFPPVIVLSGGNPELAPRWPLEIIKATEKARAIKKLYIWSDDALSLDYFHKILSKSDIEYMAQYPGYGKVCCFKGFDQISCRFNSRNNTLQYHEQMERFKQYYIDGFDLYGYVTLTTPSLINIKESLQLFIDDLRVIHPLMPLRIVPLRITLYRSVESLTRNEKMGYNNQFDVLDVWQELLEKIYGLDLVSKNICNIDIR